MRWAETAGTYNQQKDAQVLHQKLANTAIKLAFARIDFHQTQIQRTQAHLVKTSAPGPAKLPAKLGTRTVGPVPVR